MRDKSIHQILQSHHPFQGLNAGHHGASMEFESTRVMCGKDLLVDTRQLWIGALVDLWAGLDSRARQSEENIVFGVYK